MEEEYIEVLSNICDGVKGRVELISVAEDEVHILKKADKRIEPSVRKIKIIEQINKFKEEK